MKVINTILDLIFPFTCANCKMVGKLLCYDCKSLIEYKTSLSKRKIKHVKSILVATKYTEVMENLITEYKYGFVKSTSKLLAEICLKSMFHEPQYFDPDLILVPVPLSKKRKSWRGFNQSLEICKSISRITNQRIEEMIGKKRNTKPQADLNKEERILNLQSSFKIKKEISKDSKICIVDDVITTGTTISEIAKILYENGYKNICVLSVSSQRL